VGPVAGPKLSTLRDGCLSDRIGLEQRGPGWDGFRPGFATRALTGARCGPRPAVGVRRAAPLDRVAGRGSEVVHASRQLPARPQRTGAEEARTRWFSSRLRDARTDRCEVWTETGRRLVAQKRRGRRWRGEGFASDGGREGFTRDGAGGFAGYGEGEGLAGGGGAEGLAGGSAEDSSGRGVIRAANTGAPSRNGQGQAATALSNETGPLPVRTRTVIVRSAGAGTGSTGRSVCTSPVPLVRST
jgi:hypothetical protein